MKRLVLLICLVAFAGCTKTHAPNHQEAVAERGAAVMNFDLDRSTHVFEKQEDGGLQRVYSDDGDTAQVALIRAHLQEIAGKFSAGNFHEPATIHGHDMPGLHALAMGHERIEITYSEIESGGQIVYTSEEADLVGAIHEWFDAQLSDHGSHAQGHH